MIHTLQDMLVYLKKPDAFPQKKSDTLFFNQLFKLVIICLAFSFFSVIFTHVLEFTKLINPLPKFTLFEIRQKKIYLFLVVTILAPLLEESLFRYQLKHYRLALLLYLFGSSFLLHAFCSKTIWLIASLLLLLLLAFIDKKMSGSKSKRTGLIQKVFPYHFYFTALCFGLLHLTNYKEPLHNGFSVILLVLPQLFLGLVLGYTRMRYGLYQSMILHAAYNFIPALSLLAAY